MIRTRAARTSAAVTTAAALALLVTGCGGSQDRDADPAPPESAGPGRVDVQAPGIDLHITDAVAHLDASGSGTLTMTVRHGDGPPEHLDMVATPDGGRGVLAGGGKGDAGTMTTAGILLPADSTVTFGADGPTVRLSQVHGVTAAHTLPLALQFGVARLVHLTARVASS